MARYQRADPVATAELIRQVSPVLLRFLSGPAFTRGYAEDMLQECWLRIHRARHTYRPGDPLLPWIFAIARHTRCPIAKAPHLLVWHTGVPIAGALGGALVGAFLGRFSGDRGLGKGRRSSPP